MNDNLTRDTTNSIMSDSDIRLSAFNKSIHLEEIAKPKEDLRKKRIKHGIRNIVGLIFQKIEFAVLSSINYLAVYYIAYLSYSNKTIKMENSITLSSILTFAQFSSIWVGGVLREYVHMKIIMILGGSLLIIGSIGIIFLNSLIGYKMMMVLYGIGIGVQEAITNANASAYIPEQRGLINGIANISWTLSCSFFNYIGLNIVNPDKKDVVLYDDVNGIQGNIIKYTIITIICFLGLSTTSTILVFSYKKKNYLPKLEPENINEKMEENNNNNEENLDDNNDKKNQMKITKKMKKKR